MVADASFVITQGMRLLYLGYVKVARPWIRHGVLWHCLLRMWPSQMWWHMRNVGRLVQIINGVISQSLG